jgi:glycosyltransferase involved in cell wall biosynthesis
MPELFDDRHLIKIKVISNVYGLKDFAIDGYKIQLLDYPRKRTNFFDVLKIFLMSFKYDYIVLNFIAFDFLMLAFLKLIVPWNRCKLVSLDLFLERPRGFLDGVKQSVKAVLLKKTHCFLLYVRNTLHYQQYYHLRPEQLYYIPFKINAEQLIATTPITDERYVFCGGKSRRDFKTLIDAFRNLPYRLVIVTVANSELIENGCYLDEADLPDNVEVIRHDGSVELFVQRMAASRLVVLPILKDTIMQAGIAVYIMAMALHKCVIISSGPGVDDVLLDNQAIIVPSGNPGVLAEAVRKAFDDDDYRRSFETAGHGYAVSLGGTAHLRDNVARYIREDYQKARA